MTTTLDTQVGVLLDTPLQPGSPEWLAKISASKIAALLGLSIYDSPFSLWLKMAGLVPPEAENDQHRRGHYLEPAVAAWFADQHPDWTIARTGTWTHRHRDWQIASPDYLIVKPDDERALLECKSANGADGDEWGTPNSDEIPPGIKAQCLFQLDVTGYQRCHVAVIGPYLEFAEYVVERDEREQAFMREKALAFMATLERGERPDPDDGHAATYQALRSLHPLIDPVDVELPADVAAAYCRARTALKAAEVEETRTKSLVANVLGTGKHATYDGKTIAGRQAKGGGLPYLVAGRGLPTFDESSES